MQSAKVRAHTTIRPGWPGVPQLVMAVCVPALSIEAASTAFAQTTSLLSDGPPVQVVPYVPEPGVPQLTITPGTANPFAGADGSGGSVTGGSMETGGTEGGNGGDSDALSTMLGTSWGGAAVSNATALGVTRQPSRPHAFSKAAVRNQWQARGRRVFSKCIRPPSRRG
jgi:hypothetical protein